MTATALHTAGVLGHLAARHWLLTLGLAAVLVIWRAARRGGQYAPEGAAYYVREDSPLSALVVIGALVALGWWAIAGAGHTAAAKAAPKPPVIVQHVTHVTHVVSAGGMPWYGWVLIAALVAACVAYVNRRWAP